MNTLPIIGPLVPTLLIAGSVFLALKGQQLGDDQRTAETSGQRCP